MIQFWEVFFSLSHHHFSPSVVDESCHSDKEVDYVWEKWLSSFNNVSYCILMDSVIFQKPHLAEEYPSFQQFNHFWDFLIVLS